MLEIACEEIWHPLTIQILKYTDFTANAQLQRCINIHYNLAKNEKYIYYYTVKIFLYLFDLVTIIEGTHIRTNFPDPENMYAYNM